MTDSDVMLHQVGEKLAAVTTHPPPVVHSAARAAFRACLGCPDAAATVTDVGKDPDLRALLGAAFRLLQSHPEFWRQFYLQSARTAPIAPSHPWAPAIDAAAASSPAPVDPSTAAPPLTSAAIGAIAPPGPSLMSTGARKGTRSSRRSPRGQHPGVSERDAQGGPFGLGAYYIIDEQQELDDADTPSDGEPVGFV